MRQSGGYRVCRPSSCVSEREDTKKTLLKKVVYGIVINDILKSNELVEAMQIVVVKQALFDVWHL